MLRREAKIEMPIPDHLLQHRISLHELDPRVRIQQQTGSEWAAVRGAAPLLALDPDCRLGPVSQPHKLARTDNPGTRANQRYQQNEPLVSVYRRDVTAPVETFLFRLKPLIPCDLLVCELGSLRLPWRPGQVPAISHLDFSRPLFFVRHRLSTTSKRQ